MPSEKDFLDFLKETVKESLEHRKGIVTVSLFDKTRTAADETVREHEDPVYEKKVLSLLSQDQQGDFIVRDLVNTKWMLEQDAWVGINKDKHGFRFDKGKEINAYDVLKTVVGQIYSPTETSRENYAMAKKSLTWLDGRKDDIPFIELLEKIKLVNKSSSAFYRKTLLVIVKVVGWIRYHSVLGSG